MSQPLVLLYRFDSRDVIPQLRVMSGFLPPDDLQRIDEWLRENYRELAGQHNKHVDMPRKLKSLPNPVSFLVQKVAESDPRNPTLRLEYNPPQKTKTPETPVWARELTATLDQILDESQPTMLSLPMKEKLARAVASLRQSAVDSPNSAALDLLRGFLLIQHRKLRATYVARRQRLKSLDFGVCQLHETAASDDSRDATGVSQLPLEKRSSAWGWLFW